MAPGPGLNDLKASSVLPEVLVCQAAGGGASLFLGMVQATTTEQDLLIPPRDPATT